MSTSTQTPVCLAPGSEETRTVTTINLLVRGGIKAATASVASSGGLITVCSHEAELLTGTPLVEAVDGDFDIITLPGGIRDTERFRDNPLLIKTVRQFYHSGCTAAAICAVAATVLVPHDILPIGDATGFSALKDQTSANRWQDKRVVWDPRVNLLTGRGPGTLIDFDLKIIDLLVSHKKAHEVASQLVMAVGIYNHYE